MKTQTILGLTVLLALVNRDLPAADPRTNSWFTTYSGKFATPSLRNIALTAPYMHDGRFATLEEVVAHYSAGVKRSPTLDPNLAKHPDGGLRLNEADQRALVAFLKTLTDDQFSAKEIR